MQWVDIDIVHGQPLASNPKEGDSVPGASGGPVPIIRIFGVTELGNSVLFHVYGVTPYFYCNVPPGFENKPEVLSNFRSALNTALANSKRG